MKKQPKKKPIGRPATGSKTKSHTVAFSIPFAGFMEKDRGGISRGKWIENRIPIR